MIKNDYVIINHEKGEEWLMNGNGDLLVING